MTPLIDNLSDISFAATGMTDNSAMVIIKTQFTHVRDMLAKLDGNRTT
jgi:hypothetical protein